MCRVSVLLTATVRRLGREKSSLAVISASKGRWPPAWLTTSAPFRNTCQVEETAVGCDALQHLAGVVAAGEPQHHAPGPPAGLNVERSLQKERLDFIHYQLYFVHTWYQAQPK